MHSGQGRHPRNCGVWLRQAGAAADRCADALALTSPIALEDRNELRDWLRMCRSRRKRPQLMQRDVTWRGTAYTRVFERNREPSEALLAACIAFGRASPKPHYEGSRLRAARRWRDSVRPVNHLHELTHVESFNGQPRGKCSHALSIQTAQILRPINLCRARHQSASYTRTHIFVFLKIRTSWRTQEYLPLRACAGCPPLPMLR
jgi:hypothetical protein